MLLVQSYSGPFGAPKGAMEVCDNDSLLACALRETLEETGIRLSESDLGDRPIRIGRTHFYQHDRYCPIDLSKIADDITAIGWVRPNCARKMDLNHSGRRFLKRLDAH